jgi:hypothetical protein
MFDWFEYLRLARSLVPLPVSASIGEAELRSAISRAYYANHGKARNRLRDAEGIKIPREDVHKVCDRSIPWQFRQDAQRYRSNPTEGTRWIVHARLHWDRTNNRIPPRELGGSFTPTYTGIAPTI